MKGFTVELDHAPGTGLPSIGVRRSQGFWLYNRSPIFPCGIRSKFDSPVVVPLAFLGAGIALEAHRGPILAGRWQSVEQVDVPACPAFFAIAAFDDCGFNGVFHILGNSALWGNRSNAVIMATDYHVVMHFVNNVIIDCLRRPFKIPP